MKPAFDEVFELKLPEGSHLDALEYKHWRHRIQLNDQLVSPGYISEFSWISAGFPVNLKGKSVIDIGANDGLNAFIAEKRGASFVTATDIYNEEAGKADHQTGWNPYAIKMAKRISGSNVDIQNLGVYDIQKLNRSYDYAILSDVVTWLPDIPKALQIIASMCNECIVIREGVLNQDTKEAVLRYDHAKTGTHWFTPSLQFFREILPELGFKHVEIKELSNAAMFEHWVRSFPIIHSKTSLKVYANPWSTDAVDEIPPLRDQALLKVGNRYFIRGRGWVNSEGTNAQWITPNVGSKIIRTILGEENFLSFRDKLGKHPSKGATIIARR